MTSDEDPPLDRPEKAELGRLDSWKEIAAYLRRDVTTVRRWEKREGLPVHRHKHDKLGSVHADVNEIDRWWQRRIQSGMVATATAERSESVPAGTRAGSDSCRTLVPSTGSDATNAPWLLGVTLSLFAVVVAVFVYSRSPVTAVPACRPL